jgi:hypothetical protein
VKFTFNAVKSSSIEVGIMMFEVLKKAKIPHTVLEFDRYRGISRFKELIYSPYTLELMRIIASDRVTSREGRRKLQQMLNSQEVCELSASSGVAARTAPESTFRQAIGRLVEFGLVDEQLQKVEGRAVNTYRLKYNLLLFRGKDGNWIPAVILTCFKKHAIVKTNVAGNEARDEDILSIIPGSNFCTGCQMGCELSQQLRLLDRARKSL